LAAGVLWLACEVQIALTCAIRFLRAERAGESGCWPSAITVTAAEL
jgi:hypothetical protein